MSNLDFYATVADQRDLFRYLYGETDLVAFELSSEFDREPRRFRTFDEIVEIFGDERPIHLQLWSPTVMPAPVFRRIALTHVPGHDFRYAVEGAGLMQLYLGGMLDGVLHHTHFGHWEEAGARQRSIDSADDCDWRALKALSGRIRRHIVNGVSVAKLHHRPILPEAFAAFEGGMGLRHGADIHHADSPAVIRVVPPGSRSSGT